MRGILDAIGRGIIPTRSPGPYVSITQDLTDFPFVDAIGLSSYPNLGGFAEPESLPLDYYSRIVEGTTLPVLVVGILIYS